MILRGYVSHEAREKKNLVRYVSHGFAIRTIVKAFFQVLAHCKNYNQTVIHVYRRFDKCEKHEIRITSGKGNSHEIRITSGER